MEEIKSDERSLVLFKGLVEHYLQDGQPVGSKTLASEGGYGLSAATIRNVMGDLERMGLLRSPHASAGRVPTDVGLRLFVDSLLTVKPLTPGQLAQLKTELVIQSGTENLLSSASQMLADVSRLASLVVLPRAERKTLEHIEFLALSDKRVMAVLVTSDGGVSNRLFHCDQEYGSDDLRRAGQFLAEHCIGKTLMEMQRWLAGHLQELREQVEDSMRGVTDLATRLSSEVGDEDELVLKGESNLLTEQTRPNDMERLRELFAAFDERRTMLQLLQRCAGAEGVQVFIGSNSDYGFYDDYSLVAAPYEVDGEILGMLGVVGPTRMAYDRVVSLVDVTARLVGAAMQK
ncbi:MAG: heat-inducible transcriptional repressor HrcA [Gammaproteobacteria bacterium]